MAPTMSCLSSLNVAPPMSHCKSLAGGNKLAYRAKKEAEARMGRLPVEGRYHRLPRRLQDDYEFAEGKELGTGYNGSVFLATNRRTGVAHAIKSFSMANVDDSKMEEFASEVGIFMSLDHPHICRLLAVYESETEISMVMECCEGGELLNRLRDKKTFTDEEAAVTTWQMLLAINYMHSEGVVHRDLKLQNFVYDQKDSNFLKMIDFGFSYYFQESGAMQERVGTVLYMAPEVLQGHYNGGSCDMWSLGVIVFAMLAGHMPFYGNSDTSTARAIVRGRPTMRKESWDKISPPAQDFLMRLLVVTPGDRMTAQRALKHPWITARTGGGLLNRPNSSCSMSSGESILSESDVAAAFLTFARATRFEQACMQMMAWCLPLAERRLLRKTYLELDTSCDGSLQINDLDRTLRKRYNVSRADRRTVRKAMEAFDVDNDGDVHYSDYLAAMMTHYLKKEASREVVEEAFRRFDAAGVGYLTEEGLWGMLRGQVSRLELEEAFRLADATGSGQIDLQAFTSYLFKQARAAAADASTSTPAGSTPGRSSPWSSLSRSLSRLGSRRSAVFKAGA